LGIESITAMVETSWPLDAQWNGDHFTMTLGAPTSAIAHDQQTIAARAK
jgi:hypothetical protein